MNYPLTLSVKVVALAPQIYITDASGQTICYVKQKLFKFKEQVEKLTDLSPHEEMNLLLSFIMLNLLERRRG